MNHKSLRDFIMKTWTDIQEKGILFDSADSGQSIFQGSFKEILNYGATLENPRIRLIKSKNFNIGLAVARFFYLISGSNSAVNMAFYSPRVMDYSDDGKHLFGSSYGYKIFKDGRFWEIIGKLKTTKNSKRLYFPIFTEEDFLRDSKDIPCVIGFLLEPRGSFLNATLLMRANDAQKLLPYNIFEFSLLHECLTRASNMHLGVFGYFSGTTHLRGDDTNNKETPWKEAESFEMQPMQIFNKELLESLISIEKKLREYTISNESNFIEKISEMTSSIDIFWKDIFFVLADYGYSKYHKKHPQKMNENLPLYNLYRSTIPTQFL